MAVAGAPPVAASASVMRMRAPPADAVEPLAEETLATEGFILRARLATGVLPEDGAGAAATGAWPVEGAGVLPVALGSAGGRRRCRRRCRCGGRARRRGGSRLRCVVAAASSARRVAGTSATLPAAGGRRRAAWPIFRSTRSAGARTGVSLSWMALSELAAEHLLDRRGEVDEADEGLAEEEDRHHQPQAEGDGAAEGCARGGGHISGIGLGRQNL